MSQQRIFSPSENNKGVPCPFQEVICQEGYCRGCQMYLDRQRQGGRKKKSDCELLTSCPFFKDPTYMMAEMDKEQYCQGDYGWCGRYMAFKVLAREKKTRQETAQFCK